MPSTGSALRRSIPVPRTTRPAGPARQPGNRSIESALRALPSHGWTSGWVGRRDRALLVLWQQAGLSFTDIAALTVEDVRVEAGVATIRIGDRAPITLTMTDDCLLCGPCALARWLHALDLSTVHSDGRVVASVIARAAPLTAGSPHVCEGRTAGVQDVRGLPVFPEHDRWVSCAGGLPAQPRPAHEMRIPAADPRIRVGPGPRPRSEPAPVATAPSPTDHPTALENRARTLMAGSA